MNGLLSILSSAALDAIARKYFDPEIGYPRYTADLHAQPIEELDPTQVIEVALNDFVEGRADNALELLLGLQDRIPENRVVALHFLIAKGFFELGDTPGTEEHLAAAMEVLGGERDESEQHFELHVTHEIVSGTPLSQIDLGTARRLQDSSRFSGLWRQSLSSALRGDFTRQFAGASHVSFGVPSDIRFGMAALVHAFASGSLWGPSNVRADMGRFMATRAARLESPSEMDVALGELLTARASHEVKTLFSTQTALLASGTNLNELVVEYRPRVQVGYAAQGFWQTLLGFAQASVNYIEDDSRRILSRDLSDLLYATWSISDRDRIALGVSAGAFIDALSSLAILSDDDVARFTDLAEAESTAVARTVMRVFLPPEAITDSASAERVAITALRMLEAQRVDSSAIVTLLAGLSRRFHEIRDFVAPSLEGLHVHRHDLWRYLATVPDVMTGDEAVQLFTEIVDSTIAFIDSFAEAPRSISMGTFDPPKLLTGLIQHYPQPIDESTRNDAAMRLIDSMRNPNVPAHEIEALVLLIGSIALEVEHLADVRAKYLESEAEILDAYYWDDPIWNSGTSTDELELRLLELKSILGLVWSEHEWEKVVGALSRPNARMQQLALHSIRRVDHEQSPYTHGLLVPLLWSKSSAVRRLAAQYWLQLLLDQRSVPETVRERLAALIAEDEPFVAIALVHDIDQSLATAPSTATQFVDALERATDSPHVRLRVLAQSVLGNLVP